MRRLAAIVAVTALAVVVVASGASGASAVQTATPPSGSSRIAPIVMRPLVDGTVLPVVASDNVLHALYELTITNTRATPVAIDRFEVRSADPPDTIVAYEGAVLASRLRRIDGSTLTDPVLAPGEQLFLFVDVAVVAAITLPLSRPEKR